MIISKEQDLSKQESNDNISKTTSWSRLKDPRIVRVSRAFGGKDRHSKVCTVKGLRDRRVRLSVPTAIQLYDLQDRLGLNQPSKVVDWLLHAAKNEIDELPPLQFPPGSFPNFDPKHGLRMGPSWNEGKCKDIVSNDDQDWGHQDSSYQDSSSYGSSMPFNSFARSWDPNSNLTLSHHHHHQPPSRSQHDDWPNFNLMAAPLHPHHHQLLVYQQQQHGMSSTQSYFPNVDMDAKQLDYNSNNNNQSGTTSPVRQLHFNMMTANLLPSQNDDAR